MAGESCDLNGSGYPIHPSLTLDTIAGPRAQDRTLQEQDKQLRGGRMKKKKKKKKNLAIFTNNLDRARKIYSQYPTPTPVS
jgi:hypothetical protein